MDYQLIELLAATGLFVASHFALSHPLRRSIQAGLGSRGFQLFYSLVALASFGWIVIAFMRAPDGSLPLWDGTKPVAWVLASGITLIAAVMLVGSFAGNPALPDPRARDLARQRPHGVFQITRHPMMWSFSLLSLAHILVSPVPRVMIVAVAMIFLALAGSALQDHKKRDQLGSAWERWQERTTFVPRFAMLAKAGPVALLGGTLLWLGVTWGHQAAWAIPAGLWRWVG
jgi:uncharacterized membrane protein